MTEAVFEKLKRAILNYDNQGAATAAQEALSQGIDPLEVMAELVVAVKTVGDAFGSGELFLPELVGAADALQAATPLVEEAIKSRGQKRGVLGRVVIGTVAGDIHTIGKSMVSSLLIAEGFEVFDIGIDVPAPKFIEAVQEHGAQILGMSALLTTTAPQCKVVIDRLKELGIRDNLKIMVGGGAITAGFAQAMGADGYRPTAPGAVELARTWVTG